MSAFEKYYKFPDGKDKTKWWDRNYDGPVPDNVTPVLYDEVLFTAMLIRDGKCTIDSLGKRLEVTPEQAQEIYEEALGNL